MTVDPCRGCPGHRLGMYTANFGAIGYGQRKFEYSRPLHIEYRKHIQHELFRAYVRLDMGIYEDPRLNFLLPQ